MKKPSWLDEFKVFISRGNVIDLAVGVVVGGAFTAIVTALVNDIINPLISLIIGGLDSSKKKSQSRKPRPSPPRMSCWQTSSPSSSCKMAAPRQLRHWTSQKRKNLLFPSAKITLDNPRLICYSI